MVQLEVLTLLTVGIISLNSMCANSAHMKCDKVVIANEKNRVELEKEEYSLKENQSGYALIIISTDKLQLVSKMEKPEIFFCDGEKKQIAYGNAIFSSTIPKDADYFYGLNMKNTISFSNSNTILLSSKKKVVFKQ